MSHQRYELLANHLGADQPHSPPSRGFSGRVSEPTRANSGEAAAQVLEAMQIVRKSLLPTSMDRWFALSSSAHVLNQANRHAEAESLAREMLPILEANHLPDNDGRRGESLFELGKALHGEKKTAKPRRY